MVDYDDKPTMGQGSEFEEKIHKEFIGDKVANLLISKLKFILSLDLTS